jgi:azurin
MKTLLLLFSLFSFLSVAFAAGKPAKLALGVVAQENFYAVKGKKLEKPLVVKAGQEVELTFTNESKINMQHNFVLVQQGAAEEIANAGISAGADKGWVPESPKILAHTKLLNAGQAETIKFTAPATPGKYPFICTFPGHWTTMKGDLEVKK